MWFRFFCALPVCAAFIYAPGYLAARSISKDRFVALGMAPLVTVVLYEFICTIYGEIGVFTTWYSVFLPAVLLGVLLMAVFRHMALGKKDEHERRVSLVPEMGFREELLVYGPYLLVGLAICLVYFIKPLDGPESFTWR